MRKTRMRIGRRSRAVSLAQICGATIALSFLGAAPSWSQVDKLPTADPVTGLVQLDFRDKELSYVVDSIAKLTGKNFIYDDRVRGKITIISPTEISVDQAYAVFESVLQHKGFTTVQGPGGVLKIIPVRDAKESAIETVRGERRSPNRDQFVTRLIPLKYIDAESIAATVKPLVSKDASMVSYPPTNMIILTDTQANIRRLLGIFDSIDVETHKEELAVIKIKHADAATLGAQISDIYGANVAGAAATRRTSRTTRRKAGAAAAKVSSGAGAGSKVRIITDERTNSLLVLAARAALNDIRSLVRKLDIPVHGTGRIHVLYLKNADAEELSQTLNSLLSGTRGGGAAGPGRTGAAGGQPAALRSVVTALAEGITVTADPATNALVIQASKEAYETLKQVIEQLDISRPQVMVEALIMEVDVTDGLALGMNWAIEVINGNQEFIFRTADLATTGGAGSAISSAVKSTVAAAQSNGIPRDADGNPTGDGTDVTAIMRAAASDDRLNVLSAPHILTSDNEEAEIRIGNNIPIITSRVQSGAGQVGGTSLATSVNVERQDIGVTLRVTPQISEGDTLRLKIFQEITSVNETLTGGEEGFDANEVGVALTNRRIDNTVVVDDGEMVVIGGLISEDYEDNITKVPFLGDIPVLGWAFKNTSTSLRKINLLVFLTPHIIRNRDDLESETIRKRLEYEQSAGPDYATEEEAIEWEETEDDGASRRIIEALRGHARRYPESKMVELEAERAEARELAREAEIAAVTGPVYMLRAAVFQDEGEAASQLLNLVDAGYDASLVSGETGGTLLFEIQVGPFPTLARARDSARVLREVYGYAPMVNVVGGE